MLREMLNNHRERTKKLNIQKISTRRSLIANIQNMNIDEKLALSFGCCLVVINISSAEDLLQQLEMYSSRARERVKKHRKNCECCPGHNLTANHKASMSSFKFRNLSVTVNCVTKSLIH